MTESKISKLAKDRKRSAEAFDKLWQTYCPTEGNWVNPGLRTALREIAWTWWREGWLAGREKMK